MRICAHCHKPIGLNTKSLPRAFDWSVFRWLVFHTRDCKRAWRHKRKEDDARKRAVYSLYHPP